MASAKEEEELLKYFNEGSAVSRDIGDEKRDVQDNNAGVDWQEVIFNSLAVLGVLSALLASAIEDSFIVSFVGVICMIAAPAAAIKEIKLSDMESLRELMRRMKGEVKRIKNGNKKLEKENDELEKTIESLQEIEDSFEKIAEKQGQNVDTMVKLVEEFKKVQKEIEASIEAQIVQDLITAITTADKDGDFDVDEKEIAQLILRLDAMEGFELNEKLFREKWKKTDKSLSSILEIVQNLMDANVPEEENIFNIRAEHLLPRELRGL
mmetsp:Transcript_5006/g.7457  ORF Transcript_5006/g.7457 Transcript_5006/m.7457 type:complete len:266 (-) Transcript_5006:237-1034(-)